MVKTQAFVSSPRVQLPIALQLMQSIKQVLSNEPHSYKNIMLWAACCLSSFRFLSVSEFTIPSHTEYDPSMHLSLQDISIDSKDNPSILKIKYQTIKDQSF